jgi:hypothetical protein
MIRKLIGNVLSFLDLEFLALISNHYIIFVYKIFVLKLKLINEKDPLMILHQDHNKINDLIVSEMIFKRWLIN